MTSPRFIRRIALSAAAVVLATGSVTGIATSASAHDELIASDPADGATVDALPGQVSLTFSGALLTDFGGNEIRVADASGATLSSGDAVVAGNTVSQPVVGPAAGAVQVTWRVVSEDGHPISGAFSFTVTAPAARTPTATPAVTAPTASPTPSATPSPSASPVAAATAASPVPWIVLGAVLIAAVAGVVYLLVARGRRPPAPPAGPAADR